MTRPSRSRKAQTFAQTETASKPDPEDELRQHFLNGEYPPYVTRVIGTFNPQAITMADRIRMRTQPDVAFTSALVRSPIVNMRWTLESKDPELAAGVDALIRPQYVPLAKGASLAMLYGFQVIQPMYDSKPFSFEVEDATQGTSKTVTVPLAWVPKRYKSIDPRTLTLKADEKTDEFLGVEQGYIGTEAVKVSAANLIFWSFRNEDDWGRLTGLGIYDDAYSPAYDQAAVTLMRNRYYERKAEPTPIAYAERGKLTDKHNKAVDGYDLTRQQLAAMKNGSFVILPGIRDEKGNRIFGIEYLQDDKRGDMFQQAIDADGVRILKCGLIPGDSATAEDGSGSRARAEVHENRLGEIQQTHVDEWRQVFQEYCRRVGSYTFGMKRIEESGLTVKAAGLSPGMRDLYKEVLSKIMDAEATLDQGGSVPLRKRLDAVGMADDLELPMRPLDEAQEEWDQEQEERQAKADAIAKGEGGPSPITADDERAAARELARQGVLEE